MTAPLRPCVGAERKSFRLRYAEVGGQHPSMSSVVHVRDKAGLGVCQITFSEVLVQTIGRFMPRGVGPDDPVFLRVESTADGQWYVYAQYIRARDHILLWVADDKPPWIRGVRGFLSI